jgi:integration host factor subunit alpha
MLTTEDFACRMKIMALTGKTVTRVDIYDAVYRNVSLSRVESADMAELVLKEITDCIARGETVKLSSFGTFTVRKKSERLGRNPKTGVEVPIAPHLVVVFKASAIMKKQVNAKRPVSVEIVDPPRQGQAAIGSTSPR